MPPAPAVPASAEAAVVAYIDGQHLARMCEKAKAVMLINPASDNKKCNLKGNGDRAVCAVLSTSEWLETDAVASAANRSNVLTRAVLNRLWKDGTVEKCYQANGPHGLRRLWRLRRPGLPQALYEAILGTDFGPLAECFDNESYTDWRPKCLA